MMAKDKVTTRERFNKLMHWQKADRVPDVEFGYWEETIHVWHKQGLPSQLKTNEDMERYLGLEGVSIFPEVPVKNGVFPPFEVKVIEQKGERRIIWDEDGNICEALERDASIPRYIKFGLETVEDWERYKRERLDFTHPERIGDVKAAVLEAHSEGMPIFFHGGSLYGWIRNWMGLERLSEALMTERKWVEDMMEYLTEMTLFLIEKSFSGLELDMAWWWEDMCYSRGPLLSPQIFEELLVPRYKRITKALGKIGVDVHVLDCDGQIYELVPGWLKAGINCMFPIEAAHTNPIWLREVYGEDVLLMGGVDKRRLIEGKESIDRELERLRPLVEKGGYLPCVDHRVPPDVSYENYLYYLEKKKEIL